MKSYTCFLLTLFVLFLNPSCTMLEPEDDNHNTLDRVYRDPAFAEGLLITAYTQIPTNDYRYDEVATDDAVTNDRLSEYLRIANGEWSPRLNPQELWTTANRGILYINQFLTVVDNVPWKWTNLKVKDLYIRKFKGESYALRAMLKYFLLRNHGGVGANGTLLGTPVYDKFLETQEDFAAPRPTFEESMASINADIAEALKYVPMDYGNRAAVPVGFESVDVADYNEVFGDYSQQRMSGRHALAIKARAALLAASPAFNLTNNTTLWQTAANNTAQLLNDIGGIAGIDPKGHIFYLKEQVDEADITTGDKLDSKEIMWRRPIYTDRVRETSNFPPSLYGTGRINPTQNLVDAFPAANGYPISDPKSLYNPAKPYENRDPRLSLYIVYNGSRLRNTVITTAEGGGDNAIEAVPNSTRTGYYLKKLLREDVNVNPASASNQKHFNTHIRYTELYLNYAEAANEAWGPEGTGPNAYSAKDIIGLIRKRAGIVQPDSYLVSVTSKEAMRTLIRNERRLELCFEGFRFWDMRRWKENLAEPAKGVRISNSGEFNYFNVENRVYDNAYMHYGPIPEREIIKFGFVQNQGWN
ncbi:RagB/SusD family nutrient uptake outer membrane protein [Dyadobacter sp. CY312]|uniref:RagB/SusD family nutrient uptake outer membrane protein n=1 Tax=Dyadobacter sp. CY312 TaxID=2907303 RepID=UPI001F17B93F|nr:RagB/SusD family nutrient uptake outer membrane protein [Dyadobacter sp. CY312]MCE7040166.1 RagB/SusD family nutrient uptake outer membrane protein [Dyadobacter sp. CY312]